MSQEQQGLLIPLITLCHIPTGGDIFRQGDAATFLYILESGIVNIVFKPSDGPEISVSRLTSGGVFGWSAMLGRDTYTSAAYAEMESEAYRFNGAELRALCEEHPETGVVILDRLALAISQRLESTHSKIMGVLNQGLDLNFEQS